MKKEKRFKAYAIIQGDSQRYINETVGMLTNNNSNDNYNGYNSNGQSNSNYQHSVSNVVAIMDQIVTRVLIVI